jgi:hypothetical protein
MSKIEIAEIATIMKPTTEPMVIRIAEITKHVNKLRKELLNISAIDNVKAKNPFVFWYSARTCDMSCHLLGQQLTASSMQDLLDYAELKVVDIYNKLYDANHLSIEELCYDDEPEKWSQERLMKEYKKLQDKVLQAKRTKSKSAKVKKDETN